MATATNTATTTQDPDLATTIIIIIIMNRTLPAERDNCIPPPPLYLSLYRYNPLGKVTSEPPTTTLSSYTITDVFSLIDEELAIQQQQQQVSNVLIREKNKEALFTWRIIGPLIPPNFIRQRKLDISVLVEGSVSWYIYWKKSVALQFVK